MKKLRMSSLRAHQQGAALVATLAILVLLLGLTIAMFLSATNERKGAALFKNSQGLTELSDTAVNLVMAQIKDATSLTASSAPAQRLTWASQPGMIRTYGSGTGAVNSYKLYSWADPRPAGDANDIVPADWFSNRALYVDLNEPVADSENPTLTSAYRYPIAFPPPEIGDPTAPVGYSVQATAPLATGGNFTNPVPMPVQWLYMLQDGTMVYPTSSSGTTVTIAGASDTNPIVGRVAYWTDDETSKVNLNTAAGGEFWAKPVQKTRIQYENSRWQPTRWEFQRYPGHPARTDVLKVFPDLEVTGDPNRNRHDTIWQLIPRISSNGATIRTPRTSQPTSVAYDMDRLFASVGEARFSANPPATGTRTDFNSLPDWQERISEAGFLITTASRAPETTLFGTPRVSLWPISSTNSSQRRTSLDQLIAFASTIQNTGSLNNPVGYYFERSLPSNGNADVAANTNMLGYLEALTNVTRLPGFTNTSLASKYTNDGRDQILTQMYDYIRIVNKLDRQLPTPNTNSFAFNQTVPPTRRTVGGKETFGYGRFPTVNQISLHFICTADAAVATSNVVENLSLRTSNLPASFSPLGAGQRNIMALAYLEVAMPTVGYPNANYGTMSFTITGLDQIQLDGQPMGFPSTAVLTTRPTDIAGTTNINTGYGGGIVKYLVFLSSGTTAGGKTLHPIARNGFTEANGYPLASRSVRVSGNTMSVSSANLEVSIATTTGVPAHTVTVPWAAVSNIPTPTLPTSQSLWVFDQVGWNGAGSTTSSPDGSRGRLPSSNPLGWEQSRLFLTANDSIVSTATTHGDFRISMVRPNEVGNWATVPFSTTTPSFAHRLHNTSGANFIPASNISTGALGLLDVSNNFSILRTPVAPQPFLNTLNLAHPLTYGDFDNGLPNMADGAYINAPDEVGGSADGLFWDNSIGSNFAQMNAADIFHSPNRKIASAINFGSLPSAAFQNRPWQTLLFRPAPEVTNHPGLAGRTIDGNSSSGAPADHLWLDFFWMPIVEPYAISENFSTAGKVNINHRIAPFSYIERTTALEAVLGSTAVIGVPSNTSSYPGNAGSAGRYRKTTGNSFYDDYLPFESQFDVNLTETLIGVNNRLNSNQLFRSASEICELPIVPDAPNASFASLSDGSWWNNFRYTGDNTREATYNDIYPRLTTRSNTFTVHYRVQLLKKSPDTAPDQWDEASDKISSESRGSTLIERYLDPNAIYPNYATNFNSAESLDAFYRFRVLRRSEFTP